MALPIWALYMKDVYNDKQLHISQRNFDKPKSFSIELDCREYEKKTDVNEYDDPQNVRLEGQ